MGQVVSRRLGSRLSEISKAKDAAAPRRRLPGEPVPSQQHSPSAAASLANQRQPPAATSTANTGKTTAAAAAGGASSTESIEMPADLIQFLQDAGPLQRSIDRDLTSPKVYDVLVEDDEARVKQAKQANLRVRRKMPIVTPSAGGAAPGSEEDGMLTARTTNFSTADRPELSSVGLSRQDIFRLLAELDRHDQLSDSWEKLVRQQFDSMFPHVNASEPNDSHDNEDLQSFTNALKYLGVPTLMKDTKDEDIVGVWPQKADSYKHSAELTKIPPSKLKFVMINEDFR